MWALVSPDHPLESRYSKLIGTGHPIPDAGELRYVGTFQVGLGSLLFTCWRREMRDATVGVAASQRGRRGDLLRRH